VKALVTGASGFVGRHMADELSRRGYQVTTCDLARHSDALDVFRNIDEFYSLVVHAAASAPHRAAIDGQPQHFARNVQLDAAMFDWAVRTGQGRVLYLSSSAAYPVIYQGKGGVPLREDMLDPGYVEDPDGNYGWTKLTGERLAAEARKTGLPVTVVRPFSGYGEDQSEHFPFRAITERVRRREDPLTIWGDGTQVRDWIHIDDVIAGALAVVQAQAVREADPAEPVNLCTGAGTSMLELAMLACAQVKHGATVTALTDMPAGVAYRVGDPDRLHRYYTPVITLAEGVERALRGR
jgi:nucleoside-diphosphate-sugar epimerase